MTRRRAYVPVYSEEALDDLDRIADYYAEQQAWQAALEVPDRIRAAIPLIARNPLAWPIGLSGFRERCLGELPFRVVYHLDAQRLIVLRIVHYAQMWPTGSEAA